MIGGAFLCLQANATATSSPSDFDFLVGKWVMHNRRLNKRLENCKDWTEFDSSDENSKTLSGVADMDIYSTTEMPGQEGKRFEGLTLRLFNPKTRLWSFWVPATPVSDRGRLIYTWASSARIRSKANLLS